MDEFLLQLNSMPYESLALTLFVAAVIFSTGIMPGNIDLVVLGSGLLAVTKSLSPTVAYSVVIIGTLIGEGANSTFGHRLGEKIKTLRPVAALLDQERLEKIEHFTQANGFKTCILLRFSPLYKGTLLFTLSALALPRRDYFRFFIPLTFFYVALYQGLVYWSIEILEIDVTSVTFFVFFFVLASCVAQWLVSSRLRIRHK